MDPWRTWATKALRGVDGCSITRIYHSLLLYSSGSSLAPPPVLRVITCVSRLSVLFSKLRRSDSLTVVPAFSDDAARDDNKTLPTVVNTTTVAVEFHIAEMFVERDHG